MADFISNLLLRSLENPSTKRILQPRLPSLFEPLQGMETSTMSHLDLVEQETNSNVGQSSSPVIPATELPNPIGNSSPRETQQTANLPDQSAKTLPPAEESQWTILPRTENETLSEIKPKMKVDNNSREEEDVSKLQAGVSPRLKPKPLENQNLVGSSRKPPQTKPVTIFASPLVKTEIHQNESHPAPVEIKPKSVLQPIPISSRLPKTNQLEQPQMNESEQAVEIHIGRIEVRAMPAPTPRRRQTPKARVMSLDDYLKSRSGDRR